MWKEVVVAYFEILSWYLSEGKIIKTLLWIASGRNCI
jgi:hypothetical protein